MNDMKHFSDNIFGFSVCRPFPPSEGVRKTQENARLRKVGKVWWTGKCGYRRLSWRCCICPPSEGVQKTQGKRSPSEGGTGGDPNDPKLVQSLTYEFREILELKI